MARNSELIFLDLIHVSILESGLIHLIIVVVPRLGSGRANLEIRSSVCLSYAQCFQSMTMCLLNCTPHSQGWVWQVLSMPIKLKQDTRNSISEELVAKARRRVLSILLFTEVRTNMIDDAGIGLGTILQRYARVRGLHDPCLVGRIRILLAPEVPHTVISIRRNIPRHGNSKKKFTITHAFRVASQIWNFPSEHVHGCLLRSIPPPDINDNQHRVE